MSSFDNFIGNFMGLPESERKKFVEFVQKLSGVSSNDESANNSVAEPDLPSGSRELSETPILIPEQIENEMKKSPKKQNTLDKWLLKSKIVKLKENVEASKALPGGSEISSNQLNEPVPINVQSQCPIGTFDTNVAESTNVTMENSSINYFQEKLDRFPLIVLEKIDLEGIGMKPLSSEENTTSEVSSSMQITLTKNAKTDSLNELEKSAEQASTLHNTPFTDEYPSNLKGQSTYPSKSPAENIDPLDELSEVSVDMNSIHSKRSESSVTSKKPVRETKSTRAVGKKQSNKISSVSPENLKCTKDHLGETIESVVKNINSVLDHKQKALKCSPKKKIQSKSKESLKFKTNVLPVKDLVEGKMGKNLGSINNIQNPKTSTQPHALEQVLHIQKEGIDNVQLNCVNDDDKMLTSDFHSENKSKESNAVAPICGYKEKTSSSRMEHVGSNKSFKGKEVLESINDRPRRSKRTLFPKKLNGDITVEKGPLLTLKNSEEACLLISNSEIDVPGFTSVKDCSKKPCLKKQACLKTKVPVSQKKRKSSLESDEIQTPLNVESFVKFCSSDEKSHNIKAATTKTTNENPHGIDAALNVNGNPKHKFKKSKLEKPRSSQRKTTPIKIICTKNINQADSFHIPDSSSLVKTCNVEDVPNTKNLNGSIKSRSTFKESTSNDSKTSEEMPKDSKHIVSLKNSNVQIDSANELSSKKVVKKGKTKMVKLLGKNSKNIEITVSNGSKKKISLSESALSLRELDNNEPIRPKRKSFLKFEATKSEAKDSNLSNVESSIEPIPSKLDTSLRGDTPCEKDSSPSIPKKAKRGSKLTLYSDLKNLVVTIHASAPNSEDTGSIPSTRRSKRKISMKSDSPSKLCLQTANQDGSSECEKQSFKEDSNLISSKEENSEVHQPIPTKRIQRKRKRLNSIIDNLSGVPLQPLGNIAPNSTSNEKYAIEVSDMQAEEPVAISTPTINSMLDCSIGMTSTLGLSQKQLNYEIYNEVSMLCSSIGLKSDELFQISEIIDSIRNASCEDVFIIRGHKLPSDVIVPSVCKTGCFRGILTNSEISKIV